MHLWIEDIVESTPTPPFFINFKVNMANFMDPHKVVVGNDPKPLNTLILPLSVSEGFMGLC
jgi:hypothetical protein